jgi:hypothetical protein
MGSSEIVGHTHTPEDFRARGSYEDTFICVPGLVDIHTEDDPTLHVGHMMMREMYSGIQVDALDCREGDTLSGAWRSLSFASTHSSERSPS